MKFEITISKATMNEIRDIWLAQDYYPESEERAIKELFYIDDSRFDYPDFRRRVKIKKVEE